MHPAIRASLGKAGFATNLSTRVRDALITSGGVGVISLFHSQGTIRIAALVEHMLRKTPTGSQILMCVEDLALDAGLYGLLWDMPFHTYSVWVEKHSWIDSIVEYAYDHNIRINCKHSTLHPERQGDRSIMECVSAYNTNTSDLRAINRVRQLHGVVHLSDIASADGGFLNSECFCPSQFDGRRNDYLWPIRHHVTRADYTPWRRAMEHLFPVNPLHLIIPLGRWLLQDDPDWLNNWDWFLTPDREFLIRQVGEDTWRRHLRVPGTARAYQQAFLLLRHRPQLDLRRASVRESIHNQTWILLSTDAEYRLTDTVQPSDPVIFDAITI